MRFILGLLALGLLAALGSAHLDAGFDHQVGPYLVDVGWSPVGPNAGDSVFIKTSVVFANDTSATDVDSAWVRFDKNNQVPFSGTLALSNGSNVISYAFPDAGVWTMTVQFKGYTTSGEIYVPGKPESSAGIAWTAAGFFAVLALVLGLKAFGKLKI